MKLNLNNIQLYNEIEFFSLLHLYLCLYLYYISFSVFGTFKKTKKVILVIAELSKYLLQLSRCEFNSL